MNEIDFRGVVLPYMAKILDFFETHYPALDIEDEEDSITIELSDQRQFLINIHPISKQIWLSSPLSGAHHYAYNGETQDWMDTRVDLSLLSQLKSELEEVA
ncbi:Iron donor protein CyaY [Candidatus Bealeia paramacronuclearis]|uniref:Iron donor protein CyaY n=1 Tax=Candidatus Bealeia paramacronuclearis TaxID=1921001 RepID=A0ABZ2C156_9PROT|nr:Iron donor protein CyaY [Candidatus Bealeia paramacronuclearis]